MKKTMLAVGLIFGSIGTTAAGEKLNVPPEGFTALFNGKDLTNWQGVVQYNQQLKMNPDQLEAARKKANAKILPHWTVQDGILVYSGKGNSLQTVKNYGDFELLLDWKIGKGGDSGIYLRGVPQVQIWDNKEGSGGLYNNQKNPRKPLVNADNPVGEWNTFRIVMKGEKVSVWLNGKEVVKDTVLENYWDRKSPIYPVGPIELQHHGNPLYFRNIFIRELQ